MPPAPGEELGVRRKIKDLATIVPLLHGFSTDHFLPRRSVRCEVEEFVENSHVLPRLRIFVQVEVSELIAAVEQPVSVMKAKRAIGFDE